MLSKIQFHGISSSKDWRRSSVKNPTWAVTTEWLFVRLSMILTPSSTRLQSALAFMCISYCMVWQHEDYLCHKLSFLSHYGNCTSQMFTVVSLQNITVMSRPASSRDNAFNQSAPAMISVIHRSAPLSFKGQMTCPFTTKRSCHFPGHERPS